MKALIVGLGSIGKRHARLLKELMPISIAALDTRSISCDAFVDKYNISELNSRDHAVSWKPDFAIIANPSAFHADTALWLAKENIPFLIEKPVSTICEGLDILKQVVEKRNLPVMVGFQLRFHPGLVAVQQWINKGELGDILHCLAFVGQYLPNWRPSVDYRNIYSAHRKEGGGVIFDLCHQIDLNLMIMGPCTNVATMKGHSNAELEIDSEDVADILLEHRVGIFSNIHLNYLERNYIWTMHITGTKGSAIWDYGLGVSTLHRSDGTKEEYRLAENFERDHMFSAQLKTWLCVLDGAMLPPVSLRQGIEITQIACACHESYKRKRILSLCVKEW
ncbi:MAG: Gfo/Idh/MocA family protein [bacterium]